MELLTTAKIAVYAATYAIDKPYDYLIPRELSDKAQVGCRVVAPFGRGNKKTEGIILSVYRTQEEKKLKSISEILDDSPVTDEDGIKMAIWIRDNFFCTLYEAFKAMLPAGLWYKLSETYEVAKGTDRQQSYEQAGKSKAAALVLDILWANGAKASKKVITAAFKQQDPSAGLKLLMDKGVIVLNTQANKSIGDKSEIIVRLEISSGDAMDLAARRKKSAPLHSEVLTLLSSIGAGSAKDITYFTGASMTTLRTMEKRGYLALIPHEVYRRPEIHAARLEQLPELNAAQQDVFGSLDKMLGDGHAAAALLQGVTGSGKTQVYMRLLQSAAACGKSAIVLVPEISLTPQLTRLFTSYFGDQVAVLHSSLRVGQRYDEWKRIRRGEARIVVGTRSAIFAPVNNLGLIILDEEHEQTYKSETSPRYHARDVAKYRCYKDNALLVLGSATPSIETTYAAKSGVYRYFRLDHRYGQSSLPEVIIADMKQELRDGNGGTLSKPLIEELEKNLDRGEQSILFINRRGNSRFVACISCGHVPGCYRCSVTLTYHSVNGRLMCHYCGHSEKMLEQCPECGGPMKRIGAGTQKVQTELELFFPGVRVVRMDTDAVGGVNSHEKLLSKFDREKIPILVGTQMVTKGLDFENVTLIGVLDADLSLYANHYRADERTFSLITQVIGRAGRGDKTGRAVIQTLTPDNETIRFSAMQDYDAFYEREILTRKIKNCPPYRDIFVLTITCLDESALVAASVKLKHRLLDLIAQALSDERIQVLGPSPAAVLKQNNRYYYKIYISCKNEKRFRTMLEYLMKEFMQNNANRGISVFADINPYS